MTLDEQIIACARDNGYDGTVVTPKRKTNEWYIYYNTSKPNIYIWTVTDDELKQWQRNYKLKQLNIYE
jgi:hypothetical protein